MGKRLNRSFAKEEMQMEKAYENMFNITSY